MLFNPESALQLFQTVLMAEIVGLKVTEVVGKIAEWVMVLSVQV